MNTISRKSPPAYAVLTIAPDMDTLKKGYFIRARVNNCPDARVLRDKFRAKGLVVYLEIIKPEITDITGTNDILDYWGRLE